MRLFLVLNFFSAILSSSGISIADTVPVKFSDTVSVTDLPAIGKWMLDSNSNIAHWLNRPYRHRQMNEPINIIIRVKANSPEEAQQKIFKATSDAGFPERKIHSTGYQAYIGDDKVGQISRTTEAAFSDNLAVMNNDHGRIFGPVQFVGKNKIYYIYLGAFSREHAAPIKKAEHPDTTSFHVYSSFNRARDNFADAMEQRADATFKEFVFLDNAIHDDGFQTTGDHDGVAIWLDL